MKCEECEYQKGKYCGLPARFKIKNYEHDDVGNVIGCNAGKKKEVKEN